VPTFTGPMTATSSDNLRAKVKPQGHTKVKSEKIVHTTKLIVYIPVRNNTKGSLMETIFYIFEK